MSAPKNMAKQAEAGTIALADRQIMDGGDIDLEKEPVHLTDGTRLTEDNAEDIAAELLDAFGTPLPSHLRAGRPSLTAPGEHSPHVSFRVPKEVRAQAEEEASKRGVSVSRLAREALVDYLSKL